jgi:hypothetical protein
VFTNSLERGFSILSDLPKRKVRVFDLLAIPRDRRRRKMSSNYVTMGTLRGTGYALMVITTIVTAIRLSAPLMNPKTFQWDDGFLLAAYIFFLVVSILYQVVANTMFRLQAVEEGGIPPYETITDDVLFMQKVFFVVTSSLWFNL